MFQIRERECRNKKKSRNELKKTARKSRGRNKQTNRKENERKRFLKKQKKK
jgi:hypothetical protein